MDENITLNLANHDSKINEEDLSLAFRDEDKKTKVGLEKKWITFLILGIIGILGGVGCFLFILLMPEEKRTGIVFPNIPSIASEEATYSALTGEPLNDASLKEAPAYCIQTPNGTDGARPQAGLNQAGVVFEAVAEAGITRFAAIYQNPTTAVIGPIRSLRIYYLEWDTPFDCTIVHAGGSGDALQALASGGYKDLTENYTYMYRGTYSGRLWNNLFATGADLKQFGTDRGYSTSEIKGFSRFLPTEALKNKVDTLSLEPLKITNATDANTSELSVQVPKISLRFGNTPTFNVNYAYDLGSNTYLRSYGNGLAHEIYACPDENLGEKNPEDVCTLTQVAPSVVIAMVVNERRASDNYHEDITTIGSGKAYVFQNGTVIEGTWNKASRADQIKFLDNEGSEIKLVPGQTFISAVPNYGGVEY